MLSNLCILNMNWRQLTLNTQDRINQSAHVPRPKKAHLYCPQTKLMISTIKHLQQEPLSKVFFYSLSPLFLRIVKTFSSWLVREGHQGFMCCNLYLLPRFPYLPARDTRSCNDELSLNVGKLSLNGALLSFDLVVQISLFSTSCWGKPKS